jgi:hypothetical protein
MDKMTKIKYDKYRRFIEELSETDYYYHYVTDCINDLSNTDNVFRKYAINELTRLDKIKLDKGE